MSLFKAGKIWSPLVDVNVIPFKLLRQVSTGTGSLNESTRIGVGVLA